MIGLSGSMSCVVRSTGDVDIVGFDFVGCKAKVGGFAKKETVSQRTTGDS